MCCARGLQCPPPDTETIKARECHFGSDKAYAYATGFLYNLTGCPLCAEETAACECVGCNSSGILRELFERSMGAFNGTHWHTPPLCHNPLLKAVMCYQADSYAAESRLVSARKILYQLCATQNGNSMGGTCDSILCTDCPLQPACEQTKGASAETRWLLSFYVVSSVFLWQAAIELDIEAFFRRDDNAVAPKYTKLPQNDETTVTLSSFYDAM